VEPSEAIDELVVLERELARLHARQAELLVVAASGHVVTEAFLALDPRSGRGERVVRIADAVREEVASALRWSPGFAQARIDAARLLCGALAATRDALAAGEISARHVTEVVEAAGRLPGRHADPDAQAGPGAGPRAERAAAAERAQAAVFAGACARLQERVLPVACRSTVARTRAAAARAVLAIDAAGQARRRDAARAGRDVCVRDEVDGLSTLIARLATEQAHAILAAVDGVAAAATGPADPRRAGERRADALTTLVLAGAGGTGTGTGGPVHVRVDVVVGLDQLLGDDPDGGLTLRGGGRRVGSVSMGVLCALLRDPTVTATMRRLVADPVTGHLLDVGRRSYRIPGPLRAFIAARDTTCRFPGCGRRADHAQLDHALAWDTGGPSTRANLGALCTRHHQLKTHADWDITLSRPDGTCTWHSPHGRRYDHHPPPL
jgi:hypothetical protein